MEDADRNVHLVSVASCDSEASLTPLSTSLLFSLQLYIDHVALEAPVTSSAASNSLLLAFQLLEYEIVVFDAALTCPEACTPPSEAVVTRFRHGKSCLFESEPNELVRELQRDVELPLTLLLLAKEHGRARLRAFASVPLYLHVGLLDDELPNCSILLRICEWASQNGSWELRDHHNAIVGRVTGAVTLSCLGKTLAPHLKQTLGVQVSKSQSSSPRAEKESIVQPTATVDTGAVDLKEQHKAPIETPEEVTLGESTKKLEKIDAGVQCDKDQLIEDMAELELPRQGYCSNSKGISAEQSIETKFKHSNVEGHALYHKSSATHKSVSSPRRIPSRHSSQNLYVPVAAIKRGLLLPRELPPPLFFQKGSV
ncbi:hypothetical protein P3T76_004525 [Phytophthora citrophthora]|uniref:Uncharacterized protein n=1 Tax=Phytophthora citrophthora TaxID=4793 RepID=A0AAD9GV04_9STRA|nr:hypothetical protein P3T76_004525 [Phytophthora citrophthora]